MISRFQGEQGKKLLSSSLQRQQLLHGNKNLISELLEKAFIKQYEEGEKLIEQSGADNDIFFVLAGRISVVINGYEVAIRKSGQHVGEMAAIDPSAKRSASVIALEQTVVAVLSEADFSSLASIYPQLWRLVALELCERLRERTKMIRRSNPRPVLFIGSSSESLKYAKEIQSAFRNDDIVVKLWTDGGVFSTTHYFLEDLQTQVERADFALMILGPDDKVNSREVLQNAPRDNVVFELGLFMGVLSRDRTFMLVPKGMDVKIPSDLLGMNYMAFNDCEEEDLPSELAPMCNDFRKVMQRLGTR